MEMDDEELMRLLLARGVPWWVAREAIASASLDRDETHSVAPAEAWPRPSWLVDREPEEGVEGLRILGRGEDDE